jgi:hypothetical protein
VLVGALILNAATTGTSIHGWTQRGAIVLACGGVVALAAAVMRRSEPLAT